jgi:hypothetical protein
MYGSWIKINFTDLKMRLRAKGYSAKVPKGSEVSPVEMFLQRIQHERSVVYAGPIAGHMAGPKLMCGQLVLVTQSPNVVQPMKGEWGTIDYVVSYLLDDDCEHHQEVYLKGWLKHGLTCLREGIFQPGQALVFAGPAGCGKSFIQALITALFGGRCAKPYRYMTGESVFNKELIGAEHLTVEDEVPRTDIRARREFGSYIKNTIVNRTQSCHGKFVDAVTLTPFWRLTISVNDEPENLMIVPPIDDSLSDKLTLFKCRRFKWPMAMATPKDQEIFWEQVMIELPAFVHHLLYEFELPEKLKDKDARYGVKEFQHPELLKVLDEMAPETRMLNIIDEVLFREDKAAMWIGTADELKARLEDSSYQKDVERLLGHYTAVGVNLTRLATKNPARVAKRQRTAHRREWEIRSRHFETEMPQDVLMLPTAKDPVETDNVRIRMN